MRVMRRLAIILLMMLFGYLLADLVRADTPAPTPPHTAYLSHVDGNPQLTAPALPRPFAPPGVVCLPQIPDELVVGGTRYIACTSAARSDPSVKGAVVWALDAQGLRRVWTAGKDTGAARLVVEQGQVVARYVVNATGAIETAVIVEGVR